MKGTSEEACEHSNKEAMSTNAMRDFEIGSAIGARRERKRRERKERVNEEERRDRGTLFYVVML